MNSEQTENRRRSNREHAVQPIFLRILAQEIDGNAENCSGGGVLFYTDDSLQVEIEYRENGVQKTRIGRLVRTERVSETRQSWAVQFDED